MVVAATMTHCHACPPLHRRDWTRKHGYISTSPRLLLEKCPREHSVLTGGPDHCFMKNEMSTLSLSHLPSVFSSFCPLVRFLLCCERDLWPALPTPLSPLLYSEISKIPSESELWLCSRFHLLGGPSLYSVYFRFLKISLFGLSSHDFVPGSHPRCSAWKCSPTF